MKLDGAAEGRSLVGASNLEELMVKYAELHDRIMRGQLPARYVVFLSNPEFGYGNKYVL